MLALEDLPTRLFVTRNQWTKELLIAGSDGVRYVHHLDPRHAAADISTVSVTQAVIDLRVDQSPSSQSSWGQLLSPDEVDQHVIGSLKLISSLADKSERAVSFVLLMLSGRERVEPRVAALQGAAVGIVRGVAMELAPFGFRINGIMYPRTDHKLATRSGTFESEVEVSAASLAGFLLSSDAEGITGAVIPVDYGEHLYPAEGYEAEFGDRAAQNLGRNK